MTGWRRHLRRARRILLGFAAAAIIVLGIIAGIVQLALPWMVHHPQRVAAQLSAWIGQPVSFGRLDAHWVSGGPLLQLDDVRIGSPPLELDRAELAFDLFAPLQRGRSFSEFRVRGVRLDLDRASDGAWHLRGFDLPDTGAAGSSPSLGPLGAVVFTDLAIDISDPAHGIDVGLYSPLLRILNKGERMRVLGRIGRAGSSAPPIDMVTEFNAAERSGEIYAGGTDVDLATLLGDYAPVAVRAVDAKGRVQLWGRLDRGHVDDVRLRIDLANPVFTTTAPVATDDRTTVLPRVHFDRLAFVARWQRAGDGWTVDVAGLDIGTAGSEPGRVSIRRRGDAAAPAFDFAARSVPAGAAGALAMLSDRPPTALRRWLYLAQPKGRIERADGHWANVDDYRIDASLRDLAIVSTPASPGIAHLDADLAGDGQALLLAIPKQPFTFDYPRVFRHPITLDSIAGDVVAYRDGPAWRVATDHVDFDSAGFGGQALGSVLLKDDHSRPVLDLYAALDHADLTSAPLFWPVNVMPPDAVAWLDRALVSGRVTSARAVVRGDLHSWPFHDSAGRFEARGTIEDATFEFSDEWPRVHGLSATASFVDDRMQVDVAGGEIGGIAAGPASASIPNLDNSVLALTAQGAGTGAQMLAFLMQTPIGKRYADGLREIGIGGSGKATMTLSLPVHDTDALQLDGGVDLERADITEKTYGLVFKGATGSLRFNQAGFATGPLSGTFRDRPATLEVAAGGGVTDSRHAFEAAVTGTFPATVVFADAPVLAPALPHFPGESKWTGAFSIDAAKDATAGAKTLALSSDLVGTTIDLPSPLGKDAASPESIRIELPVPWAGQTLHAALGDAATAAVRLPEGVKPVAATITFGAAAGTLPTRGIRIDGRTGTVDIGGWFDLATRSSGGNGSDLLDGIDVAATDLMLDGHHFGATRLTVKPDAGALAVGFDGAAVAGSIVLPSGPATNGITARFDRIYWPASEPGAPAPAQTLSITPAKVPPLDLSVADFKLGNATFGEAHFKSHPAGGGLLIDALTSKSPNITMDATGTWTGDAASNTSHLEITLTAHDLGKMMDSLGFDGLITGGPTKAEIDATFPGPPSSFAFADITNGTLTLHVGEGRIPDVEPGAGRLFGLLSLREIPRRLSLDFSDFFKSGLGFNSIEGSFRITDGNAYTDGLVIKSPAADIRITGRTGLKARDYDQEMVVTPHPGMTLPVIGALTGGPVGAAAGLVLQGVLGKPLANAAQTHYRVTGSWDKPVIAEVSKTKAKAAPVAPSPAVPAEKKLDATPAGTPANTPEQPAAGSGPQAG